MRWQYNQSAYDEISDIRLLGFVYRIDNLTNGRSYFGQKVFWNRRGKTYTESDWRQYTGSNKALNADIAAGATIEKTIIRLCREKAEMNYYETKLIMDADALLQPDRYYNQWVAAKLTGKGRGKWNNG